MTQLVFLHIAKTAGTSVLRYLSSHIPTGQIMSHGDFLHLPGQYIGQEVAARYRVISGHFGYDQVRHLLNSSRAVTFLRDPVERVLSFHQFCLHPNMQKRFPVARAAAHLGLDEFVQSTLPEVVEALDNQQTWQIASTYWYRDRQKHRHWSDQNLMDAATENLAAFSLVGLTEYFAEDLRRIGELCDLPAPHIVPHNLRSPTRLSSTDLKPATLSTLRERLALDMALYKRIRSERAK